MRASKLIPALAAASALLVLAPAGATARPAGLKPTGGGSGPCRINIEVTPRILTSGESVLVSGVLTCAGGAASEKPVTIYERIAGVPGGFKIIGTPTTNKEGRYAFTPSPVITDSTFYSRAGVRSGNKTVKVAPGVTFATVPPLPEGSQLLTGKAHETTFAGTVNPVDPGAEVVLQREIGGSSEEWGVIQQHIFVKADGSFKFTHRFLVPGDANLRVIVRPHGKFDARGESNMLTYEISQAQNPNLTLEPSSDPVAFGQPLTLHGVDKAGSGQKVMLMGRTFGTSATKVAETTSGTGGAYEFKIVPAEKSTYYHSTAGTVNSAVLFEGVRWVIDSASVSATKVTSGQEVEFKGSVSPDRVGHFVYLERQNPSGKGFHVVDLGTVASGTPTTGTFTIKYVVIGNGKQVYRIHIPGDPINQGVSSSTFEMEVTPTLTVPKPVQEPKLPH
jgi:hypothetical protein